MVNNTDPTICRVHSIWVLPFTYHTKIYLKNWVNLLMTNWIEINYQLSHYLHQNFTLGYHVFRLISDILINIDFWMICK